MVNVSGAGPSTHDISQVIIDSIKYVVKSARVPATASGNIQLIAAVSGKQIKIISLSVGPVSADVVVKIQDASGTPIVLEGPFECLQGGGIAMPEYQENDELGASNTAINVNLSANANVPVKVRYVEV